MTEELSRSLAFEPLRKQLLDAAKAFSTDAKSLSELLNALVDDVHRADAEPLEIFPVCHHSPSAAIQMIQRLRSRPPKVIFMEMCEDFLPLIEKLRDCKLPVAFQAFAPTSESFPSKWSPLSVVAPLTEFSAEFQALVFALEHPEQTNLIFVDRSVDHVFQWTPQTDDALDEQLSEEEETDAGEPGEGEQAGPPPSHGGAIGVQMGDLEPTFDQFREFLLKNAQVRYFAEWWDQYVEQAIVHADYATYRHVMFLVGSLMRRLGKRNQDHAIDCQRERFMWTRMKAYIAVNKLKPEDALYICGAAHSASEVEEYGTGNDKRWDIPPATPTKWLYGLIPSSHSAIDAQFHFPPGAVTLSEASWKKVQDALNVKPFRLTPEGKAPPKTKAVPVPVSQSAPGENSGGLSHFLTKTPVLAIADDEQLLSWSVNIVELARKNGYLSTTADSIAVYHTAVMLGQLRNRLQPSPYDFRDAAITCLEKDRTPKKRNIARLCEILLGGDRRGQVGFKSLPPLAQDVYTRLAPLKIDLKATSIQRALIDFKAQPHLLECSELLWKILYLLKNRTVRPIMGEKKLGHTPVQESWDIEIGKNQTPLIMLGYEGVTVEHVLEKRLKTMAFAPDAKPPVALQAAEDAILYLKSVRLTEDIGIHALGLLVNETSAQSAPEIFDRIRRLIHYYRSTPTGLPDWIKKFVVTGYSHYTTLLPNGFSDRGTKPEEVAGMLAFIFTLESLALSLGCQRSQLVIAIKQSGPVTDDPNKLGLLWTAEWLLGLRDLQSIRDFFAHALENPLSLPGYPGYVNGFLLALQFTPLITRVVVELLSRTFAKLPDQYLMPWLPSLLVALRKHSETVLPVLLKEANTTFPAKLKDLENWQAPWDKVEVKAPAPSESSPGVKLTDAEDAIRGLLLANRTATDSLAVLLEATGEWKETLAATAGGTTAQPNAEDRPIIELLAAYPTSMQALASLVPQ
jgi:hypothetical protein